MGQIKRRSNEIQRSDVRVWFVITKYFCEETSEKSQIFDGSTKRSCFGRVCIYNIRRICESKKKSPNVLKYFILDTTLSVTVHLRLWYQYWPGAPSWSCPIRGDAWGNRPIMSTHIHWYGKSSPITGKVTYKHGGVFRLCNSIGSLMIVMNFSYATAFYEDTPSVGIFTYRLKGFSPQPTDHYMRSYFVHTESKQSKWSKFCNGDVPRHKLMLNYTRQV